MGLMSRRAANAAASPSGRVLEKLMAAKDCLVKDTLTMGTQTRHARLWQLADSLHTGKPTKARLTARIDNLEDRRRAKELSYDELDEYTEDEEEEPSHEVRRSEERRTS